MGNALIFFLTHRLLICTHATTISNCLFVLAQQITYNLKLFLHKVISRRQTAGVFKSNRPRLDQSGRFSIFPTPLSSRVDRRCLNSCDTDDPNHPRFPRMSKPFSLFSAMQLKHYLSSCKCTYERVESFLTKRQSVLVAFLPV